MKNAMQLAVERAGNLSRLARTLRISHTAVRKWVVRGKPPAERVLSIERATGVSRHELRPDIYPLSHDQAT